MLIVDSNPPNFNAIKAVFPNAADPGVLFCYDGTIYNPSGGYIPPQLIAHEEVHERQQAVIGPVKWWDYYIANPSWRFNEELEAHIVEYHDFIKRQKSRQMRRDYLDAIARRLSGPLYGSTSTFGEARLLIERGRKA
jgi:hypothetical protein